jgi:hypothetical protein
VYRCVRERAGRALRGTRRDRRQTVEALVRRALEPHAVSLRAHVEPEDLAEDDGAAAELRAADERLRRLTGELQEISTPTPGRKRSLSAPGVASCSPTPHTAARRPRRPRCVRGGWEDLSVAEQFEVMLSAVDAVVVRKSARRGEPVTSRVQIYGAGSVAHLLPGPETQHRMRRFDFTQAPAGLPLAA